MLRTATALAALSLSAGLYLSPVIAHADPEGSVIFATSGSPESEPAGIHVIQAKPADASLVNRKNGKIITLEMVKNDAEWQEETADMLQRDRTFQEPR